MTYLALLFREAEDANALTLAEALSIAKAMLAGKLSFQPHVSLGQAIGDPSDETFYLRPEHLLACLRGAKLQIKAGGKRTFICPAGASSAEALGDLCRFAGIPISPEMSRRCYGDLGDNNLEPLLRAKLQQLRLL